MAIRETVSGVKARVVVFEENPTPGAFKNIFLLELHNKKEMFAYLEAPSHGTYLETICPCSSNHGLLPPC